MDLATIPSYDSKKENDAVMISPEDEEAELFKDLGY
jgi:hypothetical protein